MVGDNGGGAFMLIYLLAVIVFCVPMMIAEAVIGYHGRQNPVDSMTSLALEGGHSHRWGWLGYLNAITLLIILSFYSVIAGFTIGYFFRALAGAFQNLDQKQASELYTNFLAHPHEMLLWHSVFIVLTLGVVAAGVKQGLERAVRFLMPGLFILLLLLVTYAILMGDFSQTVSFLFHVDFKKISSNVILAAVGHAFLTLSLGAGAILTYSAYIPQTVRLPTTLLIVALLDTLIAILAGFAIFPIVFQYGLSPEAGPGLIFNVLPISFSLMPGGTLIGTFFFLFLICVAWTSSINLSEPIVVTLIEHFKIKRTLACAILGALAWLLGIGSLLSFNYWQDFHLIGNLSFFDIMTKLPDNILLPAGGITFAVFAGWFMDQHVVKKTLGCHRIFYLCWLISVRYIAPLAIIAIWINSLLSVKIGH